MDRDFLLGPTGEHVRAIGSGVSCTAARQGAWRTEGKLCLLSLYRFLVPLFSPCNLDCKDFLFAQCHGWEIHSQNLAVRQKLVVTKIIHKKIHPELVEVSAIHLQINDQEVLNRPLSQVQKYQKYLVAKAAHIKLLLAELLLINSKCFDVLYLS